MDSFEKTRCDGEFEVVGEYTSINVDEDLSNMDIAKEMALLRPVKNGWREHTNDLERCPFCGRRAELIVVKHIPMGFDYNPRCSSVSCCGRLSKKWNSKEKAIKAWNSRWVPNCER